jgi:serine/threonine protein kinase
MKKGDTINGYHILQDFTTAGGGLSKWTFASKGSKEYFIKEFLSPTYPAEGSPGSDQTKRLKRQRCELFEQHHRMLIGKLSSRAADGGNLIVTTEFFRAGAKYYKVTDKVDVKGLTLATIVAASPEKKTLILLTVAHSLRILHQAGVVHGDLKPDNILIKESAKGSFVAKLIDFDNSYVSGEPPTSVEDTVGDPVYYSPELLRYITGDKHTKPSHLQLSSDIFALGLIYTQFLTGRLPLFDRAKYQYPCEAVNAGSRLSMSGLPPSLAGLIERMLHAQYDQRPTIDEVFATIKAGGTRLSDGPGTSLSFSGTLRGTLLKKSAGLGGEKVPASDKKSTPSDGRAGLSGTLIRRKT